MYLYYSLQKVGTVAKKNVRRLPRAEREQKSSRILCGLRDTVPTFCHIFLNSINFTPAFLAKVRTALDAS